MPTSALAALSRLAVGADAHIGPGRSGPARRADVGIRPYDFLFAWPAAILHNNSKNRYLSFAHPVSGGVSGAPAAEKREPEAANGKKDKVPHN